jgi:hypothetical protein
MASDGKTAVLFVHGLWHAAETWDEWIDLFATRGFAASAVRWPGETARGMTGDPPGFDEILRRVLARCAQMEHPPVVVGVGVGGLTAERALDSGLARAAVCIAPLSLRDTAPAHEGGTPGQLFAAPDPGAWNPATVGQWVSLTAAEYSAYVGDRIPRDESDALWARWCMPSSGRLLMQLRGAELMPGTIADILHRPPRGALLFVTVSPRSTGIHATLSAARLRSALATADVIEFSDRGLSLVVDSGWRQVAGAVLEWVERADRRGRAVSPAP